MSELLLSINVYGTVRRILKVMLFLNVDYFMLYFKNKNTKTNEKVR